MLARQRARGLLHGRGVERRLHPPGAAPLEREGSAAVDDAIEIMAGNGAMARVEIGGDALGAEDRHRIGMDERIEPLLKPEGRPVALEVDMSDLSQSMHARVGAPGAMRGRVLAGHGEDRSFQRLLDRKAVRLPLPADERAAVIFEDELEARHLEPGQRRREERRRSLRREPHRCADRRIGRH